MKKVLCSILLFLSFGTYAQLDFGVKAGLNFTELSADAGGLKDIYNESVDSKTGYTFGAFARFGKRGFIQPELLVATRNAQLSFAGGTENVKFKSFDVPISLGWQSGKRFRVYGGPMFGFSIAEDQSIKEAFDMYVTNAETIRKDATYGYILGFGTHILGFDLDLRKEGALSDVNVVKIGGTDVLNQRSKGFSFTVGLKIL